MGGYGSGRPRKGNRKTTAQALKVDIRDFTPLPTWAAAVGVSGPDAVGHEDIDIEWTSAGFGGRRPWLVCSRCRHHVMSVYRVNGAWVCRHCGNLVYPSTRESRFDRALRKARKARDRVGASHNLFEPPWRAGRPKGMWRRTYERLLKEVDRADNRSALAMAAELPRSAQARILQSVAPASERVGDHRTGT